MKIGQNRGETNPQAAPRRLGDSRITSRIHSERPLDEILRERLHLRGRGRLALATIRAGLSAGDWLSRLFTGQPFFALRQSEDLLGEIAGLQGTALLDKMMSLNGGTQFRAQGLDTVPDNGPVLIAATHPTGLFEFCAHMQILRRKRPDLRVVANAETERFLGADMIIPVKISKENRAESAHSTRRAILDHLEAQGAVLIFGSGRVADQHEGLLVEPPWRGGPTELSRAANAPVVPGALNVRNSSAYYRIRGTARVLSGGNAHFGAMIGSLRYFQEFMSKLGGSYDVAYGTIQPPGTPRKTLKTEAEELFPGLYASASGSSNSSD